MFTQLGVVQPQDDSSNNNLLAQSKAKARELVSQTLDEVSGLFSDANLITLADRTVEVNGEQLENLLKQLVSLTSEGNFNYEEFQDLFEDLTLVQETIRLESEQYAYEGSGVNFDIGKYLELIDSIKLNFKNSPQRLALDEKLRAQRELEENEKRLGSVERTKNSMKKLVIEIRSLFTILAFDSSFYENITLEQLINEAEARGLEINRASLMLVLEEFVLKALQQNEVLRPKDSHIFSGHGADLTVEEMNRRLELRGRNPNRNLTFQSKFNDNIFVARTIIQNLPAIFKAIDDAKEKFEKYKGVRKDHRTRIIEDSETAARFIRFETPVGKVYPTIDGGNGRLYIDESQGQETKFVYIGVQYTVQSEEVDGRYIEVYRTSLETMYPILPTK
jgi:hypothetical protein